jgi:dienelactone hydrolase
VGERIDDSAGAHTTAVDLVLPTIVEAAPGLVGYNVYRPADIGAPGRALPVVVWANGGCVRHDATWATLLQRWAAAGFFVVAITSLPDREVTIEDRTTADDQARAIDWAVEEHNRAGGRYAGHLDIDRVVAAGNSCGGITSLALAGRDPRVHAVFVLSGSSVGPGAAREQAAAVMVDVKVPVGFVVGGPEDLASPQADQDYELLGDGIAGYVASRAAADHPTVSTDPSILDEVAEISTNWLDLAVHGNADARVNLVDRPCRGCAPGLWSVQTKHLDALVTT